jgi:hypothetical protein
MVGTGIFEWLRGTIGSVSSEVEIEIVKWLFQDRFSSDNEVRMEKDLIGEPPKR